MSSASGRKDAAESLDTAQERLDKRATQGQVTQRATLSFTIPANIASFLKPFSGRIALVLGRESPASSELQPIHTHFSSGSDVRHLDDDYLCNSRTTVVSANTDPKLGKFHGTPFAGPMEPNQDQGMEFSSIPKKMF